MTHYFITGTASGIGKALAELILQKKAGKVTGLSRRKTIDHQDYTHLTIDLSDREQLEKFAFPHTPQADRVVLVNNAGQIGDIKRIGKADNRAIIDLFTVNMIAPAVLMNLFMGTYRNFKGEKVVLNVSSGAANYPIDAWAAYCASKAALDMFSNTVALEQRIENTGFSIFSVAPGVVDTEMQDDIRQSSSKEFSRHDDFVRLKKTGELTPASAVAKKYFDIIENPSKYDEIVFSLRDLD